MLLSHPGFYSVVAEDDGIVVGSNFLDERCSVAGLGPVTVSPTQQNSGVGRRLMQHMLDRAEERGYPGVRLLQSTYHSRSLALYASMNFDVRGICSVVQGPQAREQVPGRTVRASPLQTWIDAIASASGFTVMTEVGKLAIQSSRGRALWWRAGIASPATQPALGSSAILLARVMTMLRR